jgi:uncharacterized membrane protein
MASTENARRGPRADENPEHAGEGQDVDAAKEAAQERLEQADDQASEDTLGAKGVAGDAVKAATDVLKDAGRTGSAGILKSVVAAARDAAQEVLEREARAGAKQAAEYLAQKAPELARERLEQAGGTGPAGRAALEFGKAKLDGAGGAKAVASAGMGALQGVVDKITPGGDGGGGTGKKTRRLPIFYAVDVGVPIDTAYNQWTQFEDAPKYMQRITHVDQAEDNKLKVDARIWGIKRSWELEITDQEPNDRIAWKTTSGSQHTGVVTFHELDENLTRVMVLLDFPPGGLLEKMASGLRLVKRATKADLQRFRAFIELRDEETGEWRGRIEDGKVAEEGEEQPEAEGEHEDEEPRVEQDEEPQAEGDDGDFEEDSEAQEPEGEGSEDDEEPAAEEPAGQQEQEAEGESERRPESAPQPPAAGSKGRTQPRRQRASASGSGSQRSSRSRAA